MSATGDVLNGRYRLDEHLATGGMGDVWRGVDDLLGRTVAIKVLRPALLADPDFAARFHAEARTVAALRHPGIVQLYDYGEADIDSGTRVTYLVMEYVAGEQLDHRIAAQGRLTAAETMDIVAQAADALHIAHEGGIVHRDVKPSNLLIQPDGRVTLLDFGVARSAAVTRFTAVGAVVGTALYMAPEQASNGTVSAATDVYALGVVAYHCLVGEPPFSGGTPLELAVQHVHEDPPPLPDDVPAPVRALVERAMAKNPEDRFPDAAALARAARSLATDAGSTGAGTPGAVSTVARAPIPVQGPNTLAEPLDPWRDTPRRSRAPLVIGALVLLLLGALALAALLSDRSGEDPPGVPGPTTSTPVTPDSTRPGTGVTAGPGGATPTAGPTQPSPTGGTGPTGQPPEETTPPPETEPPPSDESEPGPTGGPQPSDGASP